MFGLQHFEALLLCDILWFTIESRYLTMKTGYIFSRCSFWLSVNVNVDSWPSFRDWVHCNPRCLLPMWTWTISSPICWRVIVSKRRAHIEIDLPTTESSWIDYGHGSCSSTCTAASTRSAMQHTSWPFRFRQLWWPVKVLTNGAPPSTSLFARLLSSNSRLCFTECTCPCLWKDGKTLQWLEAALVFCWYLFPSRMILRRFTGRIPAWVFAWSSPGRMVKSPYSSLIYCVMFCCLGNIAVGRDRQYTPSLRPSIIHFHLL